MSLRFAFMHARHFGEHMFALPCIPQSYLHILRCVARGLRQMVVLRGIKSGFSLPRNNSDSVRSFPVEPIKSNILQPVRVDASLG